MMLGMEMARARVTRNCTFLLPPYSPSFPPSLPPSPPGKPNIAMRRLPRPSRPYFHPEHAQ